MYPNPRSEKSRAFRRDGMCIGNHWWITAATVYLRRRIHGVVVAHETKLSILRRKRPSATASMMKPFVRAFTEELEDYSWEQKAIAVACTTWLAEHGRIPILLSESERAVDAHADVLLIQFGRWYRPAVIPTCSGEHAAICEVPDKGWNRAGYTANPRSLPRLHGTVANLPWPGMEPLRIAKDGCGLPTVSNTVSELAQIYAGLVRDKDDDWIWEAMVRHPDLVGGFNRLDSTVLKAGEGRVIAKEGADGLLGMAIEHPDYPKGLGIVVKIAHGWNSQATWYVARALLGVLGINLRNPYPLHRQKAFIVPGIVPKRYLDVLETVPTWDEWDPDQDRWHFDHEVS